MAKTVPAESISAGVTRMVGAMFPKHGNNTEARRAEQPQTTTVTASPTKDKKPSGDIPQVEKALKDADAY